MAVVLLFFLAVFIFAKVSIWKSNGSKSKDEKKEIEVKDDSENFHVTAPDRPAIAFTGDSDKTKYLNGQVVQTEAQYKEWREVMQTADRLRASFHNSFYELQSCRREEQIEGLHTECRTLYETYRNYCLTNKLWNQEIGDAQPFTGSQFQLQKENDVFEQIETSYRSAVQRVKGLEEIDTVEQLILQCLKQQPHQGTKKAVMMKYLREKHPEYIRSLLESSYYKLVKNGRILQESYQGRVIVILAPEIEKYELPDLSARFSLPSEYDPDHFKNTDIRYYKRAIETVGEPIHLDREKHTCEFESKSTGETYYTSLSRCSCPLYQRTRISPCKHMLKLAIRLGYEGFEPGGTYGFGIH